MKLPRPRSRPPALATPEDTTAPIGPRRLRWAGPPLLAASLVGAFAVVPQLAGADARPTLPAITAAQLIEKVQGASVPGLSGTLSLQSHLGLPDLGSLAGGGGSGFTNLLAGSHTAKVWFAGPDKARVALPDSLSEKDVVRNGSDLWLWESTGQQVTHVHLDAAGHDNAGEPPDQAAAGTPTPAALAKELLDAVDPTTRVSVRNTTTVAGRPAYELVLAPRSDKTLVADAVLAVDSETGLPLRVQVLAKDATDPAFELGFSDIDLSTPPDSAFRFTPPPGATVKEATSADQALLPGPSADHGRHGDKAQPGAEAGAQAGAGAGEAPSGPPPTVIGEGWDAIAVFDRPAPSADAGGDSGTIERLLAAAPTVQGPFGSGHLVHTTLFNVLVLDNGKVLVGSVTVPALEAAAAGLR